jgi:hypothetical protein
MLSSHIKQSVASGLLVDKYDIHVDNCTLAKAFDKGGYHRRVATEKPLLTEKHINDRLFWIELAKN